MMRKPQMIEIFAGFFVFIAVIRMTSTHLSLTHTLKRARMSILVTENSEQAGTACATKIEQKAKSN